MEKYLPSIVGYILGFTLSVLLMGKTEGASGIVHNTRIVIGNKTFCLHHWLIFLFYIAVLLFIRSKVRFIPNTVFLFLLGYLLGGIHQGLTYRDWFILIKWIRSVITLSRQRYPAKILIFLPVEDIEWKVAAIVYSYSTLL